MPLPWKKTTKVNPISRMVADLQPPPRPTSLVVETGFPTSVIDLFVKNRERIRINRQSSKKKASHKQFDPSQSVSPAMIIERSSVLTAEEDRGNEVVNSNCSGGGGIVGDSEAKSVRVRGEERVGGRADENGVIVVAIKMFLVLVLALSTKRLAVGITLSAFLLFMLEIFGKFLVGFFKPCSDAQAGLSFWIRRVFPSGRKNRQRKAKRLQRWEEWRERDHDVMANEIIHGVEESNSSSDEIQIVESNSYGDQNTGQEVQNGFLSREKRRGRLDAEKMTEEKEAKVKARKSQRSRSAKLKSKIIKTLVPKKLRSGKKTKVNKDYCEWPGDKLNLGGSVEERDKKEKEEGTISSAEEEGEDDRDGDGVSSTQESCHSGEIGILVEKGKEGNNNWECVIVVLVILSGLVGGRFVAVVLTVWGCFMFEPIRILNQKRGKDLGDE